MRKHRGILTILLGLTLLTTGITVAVPVFVPRLPDPAVADRDQLLRWLVVRDLNRESPATREVLVRRLDEEFRLGIDWETTGDGLDGDQRKRVWENVLLLMDPWLKQKTDRYFALPQPQRPAFLDNVIDSINNWRGVESFCPDRGASDTHAESHAPAGGLLSGMLSRTDLHTDQDPTRREEIDQFLQAVQARWLVRSLRELSPATFQ